jgi:hypothetical protein
MESNASLILTFFFQKTKTTGILILKFKKTKASDSLNFQIIAQ